MPLRFGAIRHIAPNFMPDWRLCGAISQACCNLLGPVGVAVGVPFGVTCGPGWLASMRARPGVRYVESRSLALVSWTLGFVEVWPKLRNDFAMLRIRKTTVDLAHPHVFVF